jgi:hypothetical protein
VDLNKLTMPEKIMGGATIALVIFGFFPWYGVDGAGRDASFSGYHYFLFCTIPVVLAVAVTVVIALKAIQPDTKLPDLPVTWPQAILGASGLAALLVVLKLLLGDDFFGFGLDRKFGIFLSAIAAIALVVGAFLNFQEAQKGAGAPGGTPPTPF